MIREDAGGGIPRPHLFLFQKAPMRTISFVDLKKAVTQDVSVGASARFRHVGLAKAGLIRLYVDSETDETSIVRRILMLESGSPIPKLAHYIGSVLYEAAPVPGDICYLGLSRVSTILHVFEIPATLEWSGNGRDATEKTDHQGNP